LSPGEQQLLALARVFLQAPAWLFLDEATAALDDATEQHVYRELRTQLAGTTIVSIAHRPGVAAYHDRRVELAPVGDVMRLRESERESRGIGFERQTQAIREERDRVVEPRQHDQLE
jgi:vitamin B12/bleomycin/antimicrobial peptide transport system ATP-binding/permease protein